MTWIFSRRTGDSRLHQSLVVPHGEVVPFRAIYPLITKPHLKEHVRYILENDPLFFGFEGVEDFDSTGVAFLTYIVNEDRKRKRAVYLIGAKPLVKDTIRFNLRGLHTREEVDYIRYADTVEQARLLAA